MESPEKKMIDNLFTPATWVPVALQEPTYCSDAGITLANEANPSVRAYLTVNGPEEALTLFLEMASGWAEGTDENERPCCEADIEAIAERMLLSRECTGYRADAWAIAQENPNVEYDWDWFPRTYVANKAPWLANAFECLKVQGLTTDVCETHKEMTEEEKNIAAKVTADVIAFYKSQSEPRHWHREEHNMKPRKEHSNWKNN